MPSSLIAKAKVAGSNPVFRSNKAPDSAIFSSGSGAFSLRRIASPASVTRVAPDLFVRTGFVANPGIRASRLQRERAHLTQLGPGREGQLFLGERERGDRRGPDGVHRQDRSTRWIQDLHRAVGATGRECLVAQKEKRLHPATSCARDRSLLAVFSPEHDLAGVVGRREALP